MILRFLLLLTLPLLYGNSLFAQDETPKTEDKPSETAKEKEDSTKKEDGEESSDDKPDSKPEETKSEDDAKEETEKKDAPKEDAAEETTEPEPEEEKLSPEELAKRWKELSERRKSAIKEVIRLRKKFYDVSSDGAKRDVVQEMQTIINVFNTDIRPKMARIAEDVYEANPKNLEAGEVLQATAIDEQNFTKAAEIGQTLIDRGRKTKATLKNTAEALYYSGSLEEYLEVAPLASEAGVAGPRVTERMENAKEELAIREEEAKLAEEKQLPRAVLKTEKGDIELVLYEDQAPNTVANFIELVESGTYDGIRVHRAEENFVIQMGNPATKKWDADQNYLAGEDDFTIPDEADKENARKHFRGVLSMATSAGRNKGSMQFFITRRSADHLDYSPANTSLHTVFGRVVSGMDVVDKIERGDRVTDAEITSKRDHKYEPERLPVDKPTAPERPDSKEEPKTDETEKKEGEEQPTEAEDEEQPKSEDETPEEESSSKEDAKPEE